MTSPKKLELPKTISIGYQDIKILKSDFLDGYGVYLGDRGEIRILDDLEGIEVLNTVLHECLHALFDLYGIRPAIKEDRGVEESIVSALGNGLTEIFKRNPNLVKWIQAQV